jgi:DNA-binding transcriptional MerR regulator
MLPPCESVFDQGAYSCLQAAKYLGVSYSTLRGWTSPNGLITLPSSGVLSFNNLAEAHILKAMRRTHGLSLQRIRKALAELGKARKTAHPCWMSRLRPTASICAYARDRMS